jgi:type III pantothenate kinase
MILTIDVGNSNVFVVGYKDERRVFENRQETIKVDVVQHYLHYFEMIKGVCETISEIEGIVISCVVPLISDAIVSCVVEVFDIEPLFVSGDLIQTFENRLTNPQEIGADLLATTIAVLEKNLYPACVADIGTATKVTVINENGAFLGGVIAPGIGISSIALNKSIPHLPPIELKVPSKVIGIDTVSAIQSGVMYGLIGSIEGICQSIESEMMVETRKILTGGYSNLIHEHMLSFEFMPYLLNEGLLIIYNRVVKEKS